MLRINPVVQSCVIVRREAALAAGGYDASMRYSEDYDLWLRLALRWTVYLHAPDHLLVCAACWAGVTKRLGNAPRRVDGSSAEHSTRCNGRAIRRARSAPNVPLSPRWHYELRNGWLAEFPAGLDAALAMRAEFGLPALPPYWIGPSALRALATLGKWPGGSGADCGIRHRRTRRSCREPSDGQHDTVSPLAPRSGVRSASRRHVFLNAGSELRRRSLLAMAIRAAV